MVVKGTNNQKVITEINVTLACEYEVVPLIGSAAMVSIQRNDSGSKSAILGSTLCNLLQTPRSRLSMRKT